MLSRTDIFRIKKKIIDKFPYELRSESIETEALKHSTWKDFKFDN